MPDVLSSVNDGTRCPACGKANGCVIANQEGQSESCWCMRAAYMNHKDRVDKPNLTKDSGRTCLCPDCLGKLKKCRIRGPWGDLKSCNPCRYALDFGLF
ncbi:MAG: hypothetical protein C9356_16625 [Oleiphilus sp.]|nr:MAG: hypothetical protein C9356_16625 [Oleiphilus sp.]